jgi:hypothetical protein
LVVPIPDKWLKRFQIFLIAFDKSDEAKKRMLLWAWLTRDFKSLMTGTAMREYCAAALIQCCWRGRLCRMMASLRRTIQPKYLARRSITGDTTAIIVERKDTRSVVEMIHDLRGDYRPWARTFEEFTLGRLAAYLEKDNSIEVGFLSEGSFLSRHTRINKIICDPLGADLQSHIREASQMG